MQIKSILVGAAVAVTALANPTPQLSGLFGSVPGYPLGNGFCLTDSQAKWVVAEFKTILTNPDRKYAAKVANDFMADSYQEISDSINILAGNPLGGPSFASKAAFISGVTGAPPIAKMTDVDIVHDCDTVVWQWIVGSFGTMSGNVKGFNKMDINVLTGQIKLNNLEFNSVIWGRDMGLSCPLTPLSK